MLLASTFLLHAEHCALSKKRVYSPGVSQHFTAADFLPMQAPMAHKYTDSEKYSYWNLIGVRNAESP